MTAGQTEIETKGGNGILLILYELPVAKAGAMQPDIEPQQVECRRNKPRRWTTAAKGG